MNNMQRGVDYIGVGVGAVIQNEEGKFFVALRGKEARNESGTWEFQLGYEGTTPNGIDWYVSGGPTVTHTETTDEFGDVEFIGYLGGSYDKFYGEISGVTAEDDVNWAAKAGVKFTF